MTSPPGRQVARAIPQRPMPGCGTPLISQLLQQEPGPPGPHPPSSSSSESDKGGCPVPVIGMKVSGGRMMISMAMATATAIALPAVLSAAPLEAAVACTRKVE